MDNTYGFSIEKNDCSNISELIKLTKTYYKYGDIIDNSYLNWQYLNNPNGKPFLFTSREKTSKELAGQYLVIPIVLNILNKPILGSLSLNTLTSQKYQGKGLFTKMAKATYDYCAQKDVYLTIGFPNPQSYHGFVRKLDFQHLGDIPLLIKPLKHCKILLYLFNRNKKKHGVNIQLKPIINNKIKELDINDTNDRKKYTDFWNTISNQYYISTIKDLKFLKWRYFDIPTRNYKVFYTEKDSKINGVIIIKAESVWGFNVGIIMDLLILDNNILLGKDLLKYIRQLFKKNKLDFIAALHNNSYEYSILRKSGYFVLPQNLLPQKIHFIIRFNKEFPNSKSLFNLKNWKLTFGDYDVF